MNIKHAYFGGGCFWCTEAVFQRLKGVTKVISGYSGGNIRNPTYREICSGLTGHAELVKIEYDSSVISFDDLLGVFFTTHDPTTLNRQGNDVLTQVAPLDIFYSAEDYHQNYYNLNKDKGYCRIIISPKVAKVRSHFDHLLK